MPQWQAQADVEQYRRLPTRSALVRRVAQPTLVLGSTQSDAVLDAKAVDAWDGEVVRRRGGGGAVLLLPSNHLWIDAWIPRDDLLWDADVSAAATWVGEWWRAAFGAIGARECTVHRGRAITGRHAVVCFSGRGPGEVFHHNAKLMGVSQWRSREGSLFHACAYTHWDAGPLVDLLEMDEKDRPAWRRELEGSAIGFEDLVPATMKTDTLAEQLLSTFPEWAQR